MDFLRITAVGGVQTYIPESSVLAIITAADATGAATDYASGRVTRGRITEVRYTSAAATATALTSVFVASIPAYGGSTTILYEYGQLSKEGIFSQVLSN